MTADLALERRFYAEELQAVCNLRTASLVEALASVPRERFLRPGPWWIRGEGDFGGPLRQTPDDDPRHVYHNVSIAIDQARQLLNAALNDRLREVFMRSPWPTFKRLRRDPHEPLPSCWLHGDTFCLTAE